jgi:hypothetical protein
MLSGKSGPWLINANAGAALLLLSVAAFVDHGAIVARWNTIHAREVGGKGVHLDLCYMHQLGSSALLPLIELERNPRLTADFRQRVTATRIARRNAIRWDEEAGFWTVRARQRARQADAIVTANGLPTIAVSDRDCHGRLYNPPPPVATAPSTSNLPTPPAPLTPAAPR